MRDRPAPSADEVRQVVRAVVDATLGNAVPAETPTPPGATTGATGPMSPAPSAGSDTVAIGADHGGYQLKDAIGAMLREAGYAVTDCGTSGPAPVDYPDVAHAVATLVAAGTCRWGIVVDGAGIGSCMVANKVPGVRAACCHDLSSARNSREHNHANVLTLGGRFVGEGLAIEIVRVWLGTAWGPGRHAARVDKIADVERRYLKTQHEVPR